MSRLTGKFPCPVCGEPTHVKDTFLVGEFVRRRRRCSNDHRFNTAEERISPVADRNHRVVPVIVDDVSFEQELLREENEV